MPFAVFRRHQRKLLAIFAILAMFGFVLADSLPRLLSGGFGSSGGDPVVVKLYGKPVRRSDLNVMAAERSRANRFLAVLSPYTGPQFFGDVASTRALVDAWILQHEADALKIPGGPEVARTWLRTVTGGRMSREMFEGALIGSGIQASGEQVLQDIASQVRMLRVRQLPGNPVVTPLDVFKAYRDQTERVSVKAASFPVASFIEKVAEPTAAEVSAYYAKYKDLLPDPLRDTPGFKIPRRIKAEVLSIDGAALIREIRDKLTEAELRDYYETRKSEFMHQTGLPDDIFAGDPKAELTPPQAKPFEEVRASLSISLAEEKAQADISNRFSKIKDEEMVPFTSAYDDALDKIDEAKSAGEKTTVMLPRPKDLKEVGAALGLDHEVTPILTREEAAHFGQVSGAEVGLTRLSGGRRFVDEMFDAKTTLYEPIELTDPLGRRFLVRKLEDQAPRVPALDEIRREVVNAWRMEQARPLAEKAADEFAAKVRKDGGTIKDDHPAGRPVITTDPIARMQPGFPQPPQFLQSGPPMPTEIAQIPNAGEALRDIYFGLEPGAVAVATNLPKTVYYVLTLDRRMPASFAALFAPNGDYVRFEREVETQAFQDQDQRWLGQLRAAAGLDSHWVPSDEAKGESASRS